MPFTAQDYRDAVNRVERTYRLDPVDHLFRREFYIWDEAITVWQSEQGMPVDADTSELFNFDPWPFVRVLNLGWCEPPFIPGYKDEILESTDEYEIARDGAGRIVKYFKGRRHGFMPTYLQHPVKNRGDWENEVKPRLDPEDPRRYEPLETEYARQVAAWVRNGERLHDAGIVGGYMYLRALFGPEDIMYVFYDDPRLVHDIMAHWRDLMVTALRRAQDKVGPFFQLFLAEDICYNHGPLISPEMMREFLLPYYRELYQSLAANQSRPLHFQVDTDGYMDPVIALYRDIGVNTLSPFEVAAGCDVLRSARQYPEMVLSGGIDKRVLAGGKEAIDRELERIIPFFVARGGYIPTCDHGVPDNVSFENYMYYRQRICELDH
jgi:hypothetical protein